MPKKILIVEDEQALAEALAEALAKNGFAVSRAANGEQGLQAAMRERPDLILLDILLPVMDGMEMLKQLRQDEWGKDALVILLTNVNDAKKVAEGIAGKVYDYLIKSDWEVEKIVDKIKEKLGVQ